MKVLMEMLVFLETIRVIEYVYVQAQNTLVNTM